MIKRLLIKAIIGALLGFAVAVALGRLAGEFQPWSMWYSWLSQELSIHPQTTLTVVGIVALIFLIFGPGKKKED